MQSHEWDWPSEDMLRPKKGTRFHHARVLDENNEPQLYEVIMIAHGNVYYRAVDEGVLRGSVDFCPAVQFHRWVKSID